ncbi:RCC1-like domain-containing protein [Sorangium sp. So ce124]|uniref:RCC1-like domain-containing protein n=1 Tax=Sorangium sp. So ce124 TaxID=3133280 RepID=UPI003F600FCE
MSPGSHSGSSEPLHVPSLMSAVSALKRAQVPSGERSPVSGVDPPEPPDAVPAEPPSPAPVLTADEPPVELPPVPWALEAPEPEPTLPLLAAAPPVPPEPPAGGEPPDEPAVSGSVSSLPQDAAAATRSAVDATSRKRMKAVFMMEGNLNIPETSSPKGTFLQISAGADHTCGRTTDGAVDC